MCVARNKKGQFVSEGALTFEITKKMKSMGDEIVERIKPKIRDELEQTLRSEIYASYTPADKKSQKSNKDTKNQNTRPYHHTGILVSSIQGVIEGDTITAGPMEGVT